jgi:tripartite-type tricarboxylate transporter receptor subunit TctC
MRVSLQTLVPAAILATLAGSAGAAAPPDRNEVSAFPSRPMRFIVPFPPGAATDAFARIVSQRLAERFGQPVVVDNRAGAGGTIGTDAAAKAPPDGHTILMAPTSHAINATLYRKLPYDPVADFAPITLLASLPNALFATLSLPARNAAELIALARSRPGQLNYGSGGNGSAAHLAMELFRSKAGIDMVHVPYKGGGQALTDLIGGQLALTFISVYTALPQVKAGRMKSLGVASARRSPTVPDWPTIAESGLPGFEFTAWYGILAPAGTPAAVVAKLNREIVAIANLPEIRDKALSQGAEMIAGSSAEFGQYLRAEVAKWAPVVRTSGARVD